MLEPERQRHIPSWPGPDPESKGSSPHGHIYLGDASAGGDPPKILKANGDGQPLDAWGHRGACGCGDGQFQFVGGIAVDQYNNVYVSDAQGNRIQKFRQP